MHVHIDVDKSRVTKLRFEDAEAVREITHKNTPSFLGKAPDCSSRLKMQSMEDAYPSATVLDSHIHKICKV